MILNADAPYLTLLTLLKNMGVLVENGEGIILYKSQTPLAKRIVDYLVLFNSEMGVDPALRDALNGFGCAIAVAVQGHCGFQFSSGDVPG